MLNLNRPAVISQYFGRYNPHKNTKFNYDPCNSLCTVTVSTDPMQFVTRKMTNRMTNIVDTYSVLKQSRCVSNIEYYNLSEKFNHCTVLLYYADASTNWSSPITYSFKYYKFDTRRNYQVKATHTVVYALGDSITLNRKRIYVGNKKSTNTDNSGKARNAWCNDAEWSPSYDIHNGGVTVINPIDEDPKGTQNISHLTQYVIVKES